MKFNVALSGALFAASALAAPLTAKRQARHEARRLARAEGAKTQRHSNPPFQPDTHDVLQLNSTSHVQYSSNWAGAVLVGSGYTAVTGVSEAYSASAWVGIDGDTDGNAILQTGVDFTIQDGEVSYDAWYEWFPDYAYDFSGIDISSGDVIKVTVEATTKSSGTATVENTSNGQKVSHTFTSGEVEASLGEVNAEWIVEDFEQNGSLVPLVDFGTVTFTDAEAVDNGATVTPAGAQILDIKQNNQVLTDSSVSGSSVTVKYV
ncbi:hypothetical protein N7470_008773 [Penicillium chermesinum]|nr:hypothetical protein N7470_008773 [Penicillium chermesinum]